MPQAKWRNRAKRGLTGDQTALPYGTSYQTYRNPGPRFSCRLDGEDTTTVAPHSGPEHWYAGYQSQSDSVLDVDSPAAGGETLDFWTWYFIEEGWDYGFVEAQVGGEWQTVPLTDDAGEVVTTDDDPQGNNTEGNGLTGTSGGEYFVDEPQYVHLPADAARPARPTSASATRPTRPTSTRAGSSTTSRGRRARHGLLAGRATGPARPASRTTTGSLQIVSPCDLNGGEHGERDRPTTRATSSTASRATSITRRCSTASAPARRGSSTVVSNLPTGDLQFLDAPYAYALTSNPR